MIGASGVGDPYYPDDGNGGYDVSHYEVSVRYDPTSHVLTGDTTVTARSTATLGRFNLDLLGLTVDSVAVNDRPARFVRSGAHELVITPVAAVPSSSSFRTRVRYHGVPVDRSVNRDAGWNFSSSGGSFAANEPHSASSWYPVNDTPRDKATFTLHATVPTAWSVMSNGRPGPTTLSAAAGLSTFTWVETTPIIGYLTTFAVDHWTYLRSTRRDGTPVISAFAPGAEGKRGLAEQIPAVLDFIETLYGRYPLDAGGGIFVPDRIGFSLETQTRPIYANWTELDTLVHEQAHQWWGDSMSVTNWADICMNECFAQYTQYLYNERVQGVNLDARYRSIVASNRYRPAFWSSPLYDMGPGHEFTAVYSRGPLFLHALRRLIGDSAFFQILRAYPSLHRNGNTTMAQFRAYVTAQTHRDLKGFFDAWLNGRTVPATQYLWPGSLHP